ncbi:MAG: peptide chain release factor 2 [Firmicutes bacterium]|jgi:peptide chain release factor 2|nr:peptide chain release factor 2 [Bacillota bacterium]
MSTFSAATPNSPQSQLLLKFSDFKERIEAAKAYLKIDQLRKDLQRLEFDLQDPDLWSNAERALGITTEYGKIKADVELIEGLQNSLEEASLLFEMASEEGEDSLAVVEDDIKVILSGIGEKLDEIELRTLFSNEYDKRDAIAEIHAGAGGTDAQDWAEMMLRMYLRWSERKGFKVEIDEVTPGQEAGILSATFIVSGDYAYGMLAAERGVHRLVRMSPFNSKHTRETSFASIEIIPFLDESSDEPDIDEKDLRIDTYRSHGAGGQHVNVTDSAVRITHLPTGIVVSCQNERSQHQNKAKAMQILAAKLAELKREEQMAELSSITGPREKVEWGSQIRSYVLAPYQQIKDLRSQIETGNVTAVLDGDLDDFIIGYLRWQRRNKASDEH